MTPDTDTRTGTEASVADTDTEVAVAATVEALDVLFAQYVRLAHETGGLRDELAELAEAITEREARLTLSPDVADGKNEAERRARLQLAIASDADLRRLRDAERQARRALAETEARLWVVRQKVHACLALLKLAGDGAGDDA